jgi:hypothetical protein
MVSRATHFLMTTLPRVAAERALHESETPRPLCPYLPQDLAGHYHPEAARARKCDEQVAGTKHGPRAR